LLRFRAAFQAVLLTVALQQPARKAEDLGGDRPSLLRIGVEQTIGRAPEDGVELPSEIVGVLYAGVEPLSPGRFIGTSRR